jgi:hypothetical protein
VELVLALDAAVERAQQLGVAFWPGRGDEILECGVRCGPVAHRLAEQRRRLAVSG